VEILALKKLGLRHTNPDHFRFESFGYQDSSASTGTERN
jgi:hypothetical protein